VRKATTDVINGRLGSRDGRQVWGTAVADHVASVRAASRLMGANVIITGLSSEIGQTLVTIGVDLTKMNTVGDLQGGIERSRTNARLRSDQES
jgi:hypothetical protein